jgi:hypothetical protein
VGWIDTELHELNAPVAADIGFSRKAGTAATDRGDPKQRWCTDQRRADWAIFGKAVRSDTGAEAFKRANVPTVDSSR